MLFLLLTFWVGASLRAVATNKISLSSPVDTIEIQGQDTSWHVTIPKIIMPPSVHFKNTPEAIKLATNVIVQKQQNLWKNEEYYAYDVYDKLMFAWNNFDSKQKIIGRWKFFDTYADTTLSTSTPILPIAMYESFASFYSRGHGKENKKKIQGVEYHGFTDVFHAEKLSEKLVDMLAEIDFRENTCRLFFNKIISPLSTRYGTTFYRWNIVDTVEIENKHYQILSFRPASILELGFSGNFYVSTDGDFALKRAVVNLSKPLNFNYVESIIIDMEFGQHTESSLWIPLRTSIISTISFFGIIKNYCEWGRTFSNFNFSPTVKSDQVFSTKEYLIKEENYLERDAQFWASHRRANFTRHHKEYATDSVKQHIMKIPFIYHSVNVVNLLYSKYIPLEKDPSKNKLSIGSFDTFYSSNSIEGSRLRLTLLTTANLHPRLFLFGYGAYGFRDNKAKYSIKTTWAFNKPQMWAQEFPQNNLSFTYEYDLNVLGENFLYERSSNLLSAIFRYRRLDRMTYARRYELSYQYEMAQGFFYQLRIKSQREQPAGSLRFLRQDATKGVVEEGDLQTTELSAIIRYTSNSRFFFQNYQRRELPEERFVSSLIYTCGLKNFLGGEYRYNKIQLHIIKNWWLASFGKLNTSFRVEHIWGSIPYPLLSSPSTNNSYLIQKESFDLLNPLEFVNDRQFTWDIDYDMRGVIMRRIPLLRGLRIREYIGFSGMLGGLSSKNLPENNQALFLFPETTRKMKGAVPYLEYNVGVSNLFKVLRISYVRRLTYLDEPNVRKSGFRISFKLRF